MQTRELARFVAEMSYESLPAATVQMAKQCILDTIGCCIEGSVEQPGIIMQRLVERQEGKPEATVLSRHPFRTTALNAALANGAAMHSLDMDDLHNASIIHLGTVVVPARWLSLSRSEHRAKNYSGGSRGYEVGAALARP